MFRVTVTYFILLAAGAVGLWLVLLQGSHLQAPADISGSWTLVSDSPDRPGEVAVVVEQSGRYVRAAFDGGPFVEYTLESNDERVRLSGSSDELVFHFAGGEPRVIERVERRPLVGGGDEAVESYRVRPITSERQTVADGGRRQSVSHPVLVLIAQLATIILFSRSVGWLVTFIRQPRVVGEMLAGIMLGPSLLGMLFPDAAASLFPPESIPVLGLLAQLGVVFFLFIIGLELSPKLIRDRGHAAVVISHISIVAPFLFGAALTLFLYDKLFNDTQPMRFSSVALFMGAAMSITAFPVLARILTERNLHKSKVGAVAITCAAVDDVSAWCMLAFVISFSRAEGVSDAVTTTIFSVVYVAVMLFVVRPFLRRIETYYERQGQLTTSVLGFLILVVLCSALATEFIGIHALFGAFMAGAIMPKGSRFVRDVTRQVEPFTLVVLLPIFFAFTGLRTRIDLINSVELWLFTGLIIAVACAGKFGGSTLAAAACGFKWREASVIGILMNTRGLMELVILSIGRELGVITDAVYTMMVLMALVTTFLTTPILDWVYPERLRRARPATTTPPERRHESILIPISLPRSGRALVQIADLITGPTNVERRVVGLHLRRADEREGYTLTNPAADTLEPLATLQSTAELSGLTVEPVSLVTSNPASDIARVAEDYGVGLVLMGFHKPVIGASMLGGTVHRVFQETTADVAVLIDRGMPDRVKSILVPYMGSVHDRLALELASTMARHSGAAVTVLHIVAAQNREDDPAGERPGARTVVDRVFKDPSMPLPVTFKVLAGDDPIDVVLQHCRTFDIVLVGVAEQWGLSSQLFGWKAERIARDCPTSMLLVRRGQHEKPVAGESSSTSSATVAESSGVENSAADGSPEAVRPTS